MIFQLTSNLEFPQVHLAEEDGLLAYGGDLRPERLLLAYRSGIFPWYSEEDPILWHSPDPRFVLFPEKLKISSSMRQWMKKQNYTVTFNQAFKSVIQNCSAIERTGQDGTWIIDEMQEAYLLLHELGNAISVEVWNESNELVGGLYGVLLHRFFAGESMFSKENNCSKLALISLIGHYQISFIDCQVHTAHLESLGAEMISRESYLALLDEAL